MRNSWKVFTRDVMRLVRTRKAWVIVLGVLITPALYAWFNINAFWDPYASTANIRVAVANLDAGGSSDLAGHIDVGAQVVDQLKDNRQLGWEFMDEREARRAVARGDAYAAIVIPEDFSRDLLSITTGSFTQPALRYYVNVKANAIAPKITDVGASTLDKQITAAFTDQVTQAATTAVKEAGVDTEERLETEKQKTLAAFDEATAQVAATKKSVGTMQAGIASSRDGLGSAKRTLHDVDATLEDVQTSIAQAQQLVADAQTAVLGFTDAASTAYVSGTALLADAASTAGVAASRLTGAFDDASVRVDTALTDVRRVAEANAAAIERLQTIVDDAATDPAAAARLQDVISSLRDRNATDQQLLDDLQGLNDTASDTSKTLSDTAAAVASATRDANAAASGARSALTDNVPALNSAMSALSTSAGRFSAAVGAQREQVEQAVALLDGLDTQLASTSDALGSFASNLGTAEQGLETARTDVAALGAATAWQDLRKVTGLDPERIAQFVASPVQVLEHAVFPVDTYGSAMAALFTNLSLWIGAFVMMVIFKIEVDTEGVPGITVGEAYLGRFWLFAVLASLQALVVSIGDVVIGVQMVSPVVFVGTCVLIALAYVSIVYALSVAFGHVGRGLCILLVIMQIPGASGLYPIEMMPAFFRDIYPLLPFTYGIDALRETIAGFFDGTYAKCLAVLALFVVLSFLIGLVLRSRLASLNLLFNRQIADTDLLIGERVQVTGGGYRLADVYHALADRDRFREDMSGRAARFRRRYPRLLRGTLVTGVAGIALLAVVAWAFPDAKALLLGLWVLWLLLSIAFLVVLEYVRDSHAQAQQVANLDDVTLREYAHDGVMGRHAPVHAPSGAAPVSTAPTVVLDPPRDAADGEPRGGADDDTSADDDQHDALLRLFQAEQPRTDADEPDTDGGTRR